MLRRIRKAQSTLEYMAIFAAVVGAIVVFASKNVKTSVDKVLGSATGKLEKAAGEFDPTIK